MDSNTQAVEREQSDKELLVLAAKAAGYQVERWSDDDSSLLLASVQEPWNPLTDDGDALRLAVKLKLDIYHYSFHYAPYVSVHEERNRFSAAVRYADCLNHEAATRLAIVRAAAEIGKAMP